MKDSSEIDSWNGSWYDDGETSDLKAYYEAKAKREEWSAGEVIIVEDLKEYDTQGCKEIDYRQPMETLVRDLEQEVRAELGAPPILAEVCT